jgi:hypothetical protein
VPHKASRSADANETKTVEVQGPSSVPLRNTSRSHHSPEAASISANNRATFRRSSGYIVSMSMMSAQSSPRSSR